MGYARHIGRIGTLAVALGVGAAVLTTPAIGYAQPTDSDSSQTDNASVDPSSGSPADTTGEHASEADGDSADDAEVADGDDAEVRDADADDLADADAEDSTPTRSRKAKAALADDDDKAADRTDDLLTTAAADDDLDLSVTSTSADAPARPVRTLAGLATSAVASVASAVSTRQTPALPESPAAVVKKVASPLFSAAVSQLLGGDDGDGLPSLAPLALLAFVRREFEDNLRAAANVGAEPAGGVIGDILESPLGFIQEKLFNNSPTYAADTESVKVQPGWVSTPFKLDARDGDGEKLTYSVNGSNTVVGDKGGTLTLLPDGMATYTAPVTWNGETTYTDKFTGLTASDASNGPHVHGARGLLNLLTFGVLGEAGHTATSTLEVNVAPVPGVFPVKFVNNTGPVNEGGYTDEQIYLFILGQVKNDGHYSYLDKYGQAHLIETTTPSSDMTFSLAELGGNLTFPPAWQGGRIYISKGAPLTVKGNPGNQYDVGLPQNPGPNYLIPYDFYELTFKYGEVAFGADPSYVDEFSMPLTSRVPGAPRAPELTGLNMRAAEVYAGYAALPEAWQGLLVKDANGKPVRIIAPRSAVPGDLATWMEPAVEEFWTKYADEDFTWDGPGYKVTNGRIGTDGKFHYTLTPTGVPDPQPGDYTMDRPTSAEIFAANGAFDSTKPDSDFRVQFNAALNRGVATSPLDWHNPAAYYPEQTDTRCTSQATGCRYNDYAKYLHSLALEKLLYAMPKDDINDQSGVQILAPSTDPPSLVTITIG